MTKVFLTGATGYIGGSVLDRIYSAHPEWTFTCLVRSPSKGQAVIDAFPKVRIVIGDLTALDLIKSESTAADIVVHTADSADNEGAAQAIADGLASKDTPGYWLHTGGAGILIFSDLDVGRFGFHSDKVYDDLDGVKEVTHGLPEHAFHWKVDQLVLKAGVEHSDSVKTAIVCPPTIYGLGRGPGSKRSIQVNNLTTLTLKRGKAPVIGEGKSVWNHVHIDDLADLYLLLAEAAAAKRNDPELWGERGYFFAESGEHEWGAVAKKVAEAAAWAGYIPSGEVETITVQDALGSGIFAAATWGLNCRASALRARKYLGWNPHGPSLEHEIPAIVESEKNSIA
ncbi:hypothetical protein BJ742DRAFT_874881 [Cladochytrium replicatum]|nr:hypothetical protein BJ742DRAFT_874881 [Cladochytrium replicatum]